MDILTFQGSRYQIGCQIGAAFQGHAQEDCLAVQENPPPGEWQQSLLYAMHLTQRALHQVFAEVQGVAKGAGVSLSNLFLSLYEDLWDSLDPETGCTDLAADSRATKDQCMLLGHNNDAEPDAPPPYLLRLIPDQGPVVTGVALGGVGLSVGVNDQGLVILGNQVLANDVRPGIPRILLVRAALDHATIAGALKVLLHPDRASSYNNLVGHQSGQIVSVEGSGTKSHRMRPTEQGIMTHANHYLHPRMRDVEDKKDMRSTQIREQRACQLMSAMAGQHTVGTFQRVLTDHAGYPDSICRHNQQDAVTGFSLICEAERRVCWYAPGPPCQFPYEPFRY